MIITGRQVIFLWYPRIPPTMQGLIVVGLVDCVSRGKTHWT